MRCALSRSDPQGDTPYPETKKKFPKVVAFDTSGPFCALGFTTESYSSSCIEEMKKGQAERLFPFLAEAMGGIWTWHDVDAIGVGVGPGSFTGVRIAVSAARGLSLSLGIPAFGISTFETVRGRPGGRRLISLPAPRGQAYVQGFIGAETVGRPRLIDPSEPPADLQLSFGIEVYGYQAEKIARALDVSGFEAGTGPDPKLMAELAEKKYLTATEWPDPPAPIYIRPADAAPPRHKAPTIVE